MLQVTRRAVWRLLSPANQTTPKRHFHKDYNPTLEDQTLTLPDNRTLGFAEYGNPSGIPVFTLHGSPGSRYDGIGFSDLADKLNLRIVCPDRPGYGLSSLQPGQKLVDYPADISRLAAHLGIPAYHVVGASGGGPYTVACAYGAPQGELLSATVIAGAGPPEMMTVRDAGWYTVAALGMQRWLPGVMRVATRYYMADDERLRKHLQWAYKWLSEEDRAVIEEEDAQGVIMASLKAAYAQGAEGAIQDARMFNEPWGFGLADVGRKVLLVYGKKDNRTPVAFGRYYKKHLPKAELIEYDDASHFTIHKKDEEVFAKIIGKENLSEDM